MKDCIDANKVQVEWCPTKLMVVDFMTKLLQGAAFQNFRDKIMGDTSTIPKLGMKYVKKFGTN